MMGAIAGVPGLCTTSNNITINTNVEYAVGELTSNSCLILDIHMEVDASAAL